MDHPFNINRMGNHSGNNRNIAPDDNTTAVNVVRGRVEQPEPIYMQISVNSPSVTTVNTNSTSLPITTTVSSITGRTDVQRRAVEDARRHIRENFNVMLQPLVDTARFMNVLHHQSTNNTQTQSQALAQASSSQGALSNNSTPIVNSNSIVVNIEDNSEPTVRNEIATSTNNDMVPTQNNADPHNIEVAAETQAALVTLLRYVPFLLILLVKSVYIHHEGIFNFIILFMTFVHCNSVVKKEATKGPKRNKSKLLLALLYIIICMMFINYVFEEERLYRHLVLMHTFNKSLTVWNLLWFVAVNDFMLKLITISIKIAVTLMPGVVLQFKKRGKIYLAIEAVSQLYRSLTPIMPWLLYLTESHQKSFFIFGLILVAFYLIFKSVDIYTYLKFVNNSIKKLFQNMSIGSAPSKEQIQAAGEHCPICHDTYESPVLLHCRHIFCENCVTTWFDREQTCPLCRAKIVDDPSWRDGSTTFFLQLF